MLGVLVTIGSACPCRRKRTTVYRKTNQHDLDKHFQKLNKKKPVLVVRRKIDNKGRHVATDVDVRSTKLCAILQDQYNGVEGLDISRNPPYVSTFYHPGTRARSLTFGSVAIDYCITRTTSLRRSTRRRKPHAPQTKSSLTTSRF
jgi:hypothetical protein